MALQFGMALLGTVLWICICFPLQKGFNIAHGYHLYESPETSDQFPFGVSLNTNYEDETEATRQQSFVSPQTEPVLDTDGQDVSPDTSLGEEKEQRQPDSVQEEDEFLEASPLKQKYEHSSADHHPFGVLLKEHTEKDVIGISFPTINHFERFVEIMKNAFLTPGSDVGIHFQTAQEALKNVESSGEFNLKNETSTDVDNHKQKVWNGQDASYKTADLLDSSESLGSSSISDNQEFRPHYALDARYHLAATDIDLSNMDDRDFPVQSTSNDQLQQMHFPSGSYFGENFSTASPLKYPDEPSQDSSNNESPSLTPPEANIPNSEYTSHSNDYLKGYQSPSDGFELGKDFQRVTQPDDLRTQKPASLSYHGKRLYAPIDRLPNGKIPAKYSNNVNYTPTIYQPGTGSSVSSSSNSLLPQSSVSIQTSIPQELQNQMDKSHLVFTVKPSNSLHGTSKNNGYLGFQKDSIMLNKDDRNVVFDAEEPNDNTVSSDTDSPQGGITSYRTDNVMHSFSKPQKQAISLNGINAGVMKTLPSSLTMEHRNFPYWFSEWMSVPKGFALRITPRDGEHRMSLPPRPARNVSPLRIYYAKSTNRYTRAAAHRSNTRYTPYRRAQKESLLRTEVYPESK
ncbi:uncharacterized protein LOC125015156 [Mugil cephalus]|uniref:uncharacterized protein LOC125015156 n=1 Tax=Mugil cephalus TaxID=48193 RepID=UPI001FB826D0|nr:uncharacterized protein LOC125015156 [Mugil cephalus]